MRRKVQLVSAISIICHSAGVRFLCEIFTLLCQHCSLPTTNIWRKQQVGSLTSSGKWFPEEWGELQWCRGCDARNDINMEVTADCTTRHWRYMTQWGRARYLPRCSLTLCYTSHTAILTLSHPAPVLAYISHIWDCRMEICANMIGHTALAPLR